MGVLLIKTSPTIGVYARAPDFGYQVYQKDGGLQPTIEMDIARLCSICVVLAREYEPVLLFFLVQAGLEVWAL